LNQSRGRLFRRWACRRRRFALFLKEVANLLLGIESDTLGLGGMACSAIIVVRDRICSRGLVFLDKFRDSSFGKLP
jgi:hypothetical protein